MRVSFANPRPEVMVNLKDGSTVVVGQKPTLIPAKLRKEFRAHPLVAAWIDSQEIEIDADEAPEASPVPSPAK